MALVNTINFLPEVFRTATNQRFLGATMDQLVTDAVNVPLNGYIGRTFAPTYKQGDNYVPEINSQRKNYQLEPSVVVKDAAGEIVLNSGFVDLLQSVQNKGGFVNDQQRLFKSQAYNYDGHFDYDKFVNYSNYYWLPDGPDAVTVSSSNTPYLGDYVVTRNAAVGGYTFSTQGGHPNTQLTLARGGTYNFTVNQPGFKFWIQTEAGTSGRDTNIPTLSTREVFGVTNNGTDNGVIRFNVPRASAQDFYTGMPIVASVDSAVEFTYSSIQNTLLSEFLRNNPLGLDGITTQLQNKTIIFIGNQQEDSDWSAPGLFEDGVAYDTTEAFDTGGLLPGIVPDEKRQGVWTIRLVAQENGDSLIRLEPTLTVNPLQKIFVTSGNTRASMQYWLNNNRYYVLVPKVTAVANYLYYQDSVNPDFVGQIQLVDNISSPINVTGDIIGKTSYTSPNGVVFTNGLKVKFDTLVVPSSYAGAEFYVEGVGTSIQLVSVDQLVVPSAFIDDIQTTADYITINRASQDMNAWSRTNRWFHKDVLTDTANYNKTTVNYGPNIAGRRAIVEFEPNLQLFNFGVQAKQNVDVITFDNTDAFADIEGSISYTLDGVVLTQDMRVVFANDYDETVKGKVWTVDFKVINHRVYLRLLETADDPVEANQTVLVTKGNNAGNTYRYDGSNWFQCQEKTSFNQTPLFDLIDSNGYSFSDTTVYPGSTFTGTKFFGYAPGTGKNDVILGFPLKYQNFNNIGDIVFQNYYDTDTFNYVSDSALGTITTVDCSTGYLIKNNGLTNYTQYNNWIASVEPTEQYQIITKFHTGYIVTIDGVDYPFVQVDILPTASATVPHLKVFVNNKLLNSVTDYQLVEYGVYHIVTLNVEVAVGDKIDVAILSDSTSALGYYEVPENLDFNPLNESFDSITLGQLRTHYNKLIENTSVSVDTEIPLQDRYLKAQGGTLLQHSSPLIYSMAFMTDPVVNFMNAIDLARKEYTRFKNKFVSLCTSLRTLDYSDPVSGVDTILKNINAVKNSTFPWYYSDMVPQGDEFSSIVYTISNARQKQYEISSIFDITVPSGRSVLVYLNGKQLTYQHDYVFNVNNPSINITATLVVGDKLEIRDYASTDGNYIPETPTKLGLYPSSTPSIYLDTSYRTPTNVIRGHDGSLTPAFGDFRDDYLLELELRIFNNLKNETRQDPTKMFDTIPGRFRDTGYSLAEWNQLLTKNFLQWVGSNNIDYTTNTWFDANDPWTWNYDQFRDSIDGSFLQGSWRAIYKYWYDTDTPSITPWEMLGLLEEPTWWQERYGPAPYTTNNTLLGQDLSSGYVWNGSDAAAYYDTRFARPGINVANPTDAAGNIIDPTRAGVIGEYNNASIGNSFKVGEHGPVETAWRRSSDYPYAVQVALALARPAEYFATEIDTSRFYINPKTGQFSNSINQKISPSMIVVNGDTTTIPGTVLRTAGYINWIADSIKNLGYDPVSKINTYLKNLTVQLSYKVAGFTDQNLITVTAEQTSPGSTNASIIIPDENYKIYLGKSVPVDTIVYSAVVVTKVENGYSVAGYNTSNPFFTILPSVVNNNRAYTVSANGVSVRVYQDGTDTAMNIPYGTTFSTAQQVADFLVSYQRYLESRGFVFKDFDSDLQSTRDWILSIQEFLAWTTQGWTVGTLLVLNPVSDRITVSTTGTVVDEITNTPHGSRLLNTNFAPVRSSAFTVLRVDRPVNPNKNRFLVQTVDGLSTIAFAQLDLIQYENSLIFDNVDSFGDIIYIPSQGTRQYRLKVNGVKTGLWDGAMSPTGYIYSDPVINAWQPDTDYKQGDIVTYNNSFYTAPADVTATQNFNLSNWTRITSGDIQTGLLPSLGHNAQIFNNIYDVDNPPQDENYQIYSAGLIGFRQRPFLSNLGLSVTTQTKFYQGYIKQKGTKNAVDALTKATFDTISSQISTYEEWAFLVGQYGDLDNNIYTEIVLDESEFRTNPVAFTLTEDTYSTANIIVKLGINTASVTGGNISSNIYTASNLSSISTSLYSNRQDSVYATDLPTAGYVNLNDVEYQMFDITTVSRMPPVGSSDKIWVAKDYKQPWNVYRVNKTGTTAVELRYTLDTYAQLTFNNPHNLTTDEYFVLQGFSDLYDGLYRVISVPNTLNIIINVRNIDSLIRSRTSITGEGLVFSFGTLVINSVSSLDTIRPLGDWVNGDRVWVNSATNNGWGVYTFNYSWKKENSTTLTANTIVANTKFGVSTAISADEKFIYVGNPGSQLVQVFSNVGYSFTPTATISNAAPDFGATIATTGNTVVIAAPSAGNVFVYTKNVNGAHGFKQKISSANASAKFGSSIALSHNENWLYVLEPSQSRLYTYYANVAANGTYSLANTFTVSGNVVTTNHYGNIVIVGNPSASNVYSSTGEVYILGRTANAIALTQVISSQHKNVNTRFGFSLAADDSAGNLFVGAPGSTASGYTNGLVERWLKTDTGYTYSQSIAHPDDQIGFLGTSISISADGKVLAIGSSGSATEETTTFDVKTTVIDENTTQFVDSIYQSGAVYMFEPLVDQTNPADIGIYSYVQELEAQLHTGDQFGSSVTATRDLVLTGAPYANNVAGNAYVFTNSTQTSAWVMTREEEPRVDINSINRTFIYNKSNNVILAALDYVDPIKGKVLNSVGVDIDYQLVNDPALYNAGTGPQLSDLHWGPEQVGKIWWDLDAVRCLDYEQDELIYRLNNWGSFLPGSQFLVYEWVESPVPPSQYIDTVGDGVPMNVADQYYCTYGAVTQTGAVNVKYYFWVKNKTSINSAAGKLNSVYSIAAAIENPLAQGIPYLTILRNDTVALYNVTGLLTGQNSVLHIGSKSTNAGLIHSEYQLVQEGNPTSQVPTQLKNKLIDSLVGQDAAGNAVPDPALTPAQAYGISIRPRQSMFINQALALSNYITLVNEVLASYPVVEQKLMTTLNSGESIPAVNSGSYDRIVDTVDQLNYVNTSALATGYKILVASDATQLGKWAIYTWTGTAWSAIPVVQSYKTNASVNGVGLYWYYTDWYRVGYDYTVAPDIIVANNLEYRKLIPTADTYVKVLDNGNNQFVVYYIDNNLVENLVGIQNGTIQISTGSIPKLELRQIALAIQNDIFIDDLASDYNKLFFAMVRYALTEQKNLEWVFKTSFLSATQYIRALKQFPSYIADNQDYYLDYIDEVKPYRTAIREFVIDYIGDDYYNSDVTDFDLPPKWDANLAIYRSPNGEQLYDEAALSNTNSVYNQWYNNYKYQVVSIIVETPGVNYSIAPIVTISGGGGTGATAYATVNGNGEVNDIIVTDPGSGYTSTPTILINGVGTGATGKAILRNAADENNTGHNLVRSIGTTIKFDRINYTNSNTFVFWSNVTTSNVGETLSANTIIAMNGDLYQLTNDYVIDSGINFPYANVSSLSYSNLTNANDRIVAFTGNIDLAQTQYGIIYPGIKVEGGNLKVINGNSTVGSPATVTEFDSVIESFYGNTFGVSPGDITIDGGAYISAYASHAPEEMIPGQMFNTLNMSVYDTAQLAFRLFKDMGGNVTPYRIASANISTLTSNLSLADTTISVADATKLPSPNPMLAIPGVICINGELITYYRNYALESKTPWAGNLIVNTGSLITYSSNIYITTGNVYDYGNTFANISSNVQMVNVNTLAQIRRGVAGTGASNLHVTGARVVDASDQQKLPNDYYSNVQLTTSQTYKVTSAISYAITTTTNISANIGDTITQTQLVPNWKANTVFALSSYVYYSGNSYQVTGNVYGATFTSNAVAANVTYAFAGNVETTVSLRVLQTVSNATVIPVLIKTGDIQGLPEVFDSQTGYDPGYFTGNGAITSNIANQISVEPYINGTVSSYSTLPTFPKAVTSLTVGNLYKIANVGNTNWELAGVKNLTKVSGNITNGTTYLSAGNVLVANIAQAPLTGNLTVGTYITGAGITANTRVTGYIGDDDQYLKRYYVSISQYVPGNVTITKQPENGTLFFATATTTGTGLVTLPNTAAYITQDTNHTWVFSSNTNTWTDIGVYIPVNGFDSVNSVVIINGVPTTSYIVTAYRLGNPNNVPSLVDVNGSITVPAGTFIEQSRSWYDTGAVTATNGAGLVNSHSKQVDFLKASPGYTPPAGQTP